MSIQYLGNKQVQKLAEIEAIIFLLRISLEFTFCVAMGKYISPFTEVQI
jgi:hypothetical protein